jgi:hypothetical protein
VERYRTHHWRDDAACLGAAKHVGNIWWGTDEQPDEEIELALSYCSVCTVRVPCLLEAGPPQQGIYFIRGGKRI